MGEEEKDEEEEEENKEEDKEEGRQDVVIYHLSTTFPSGMAVRIDATLHLVTRRSTTAARL